MFLMQPIALFGSQLKTDEQVLFFPQSARWDSEQAVWRVPVHGWVFESEPDSLWRRFTVAGVAEMLDIDDKVEEEAMFKERVWPFLVDNERGKEIAIRFNGANALTPDVSEANGHFTGTVALTEAEVGNMANPPWIRFETAMPENDKRRFSGEAQLLCPQGLSVISDLDDTVKISDVLNKEELLANTFLRDFRAVPGMSDIYRRWHDNGAAFHYVSGSPWQLYQALASFLMQYGFPQGDFQLRNFRLKDSSILSLLASAEEFKIPAIEEILQKYPQRRFFLVGDSGEKDPEVYGEIARRYREQVVGIMIRNVTSEKRDSERMQAAFRDVTEAKLLLFQDPATLNRFAIDSEWFGSQRPSQCR